MLRARKAQVVLFDSQSIAQRLSNLLGTSIIEYWPLASNANGAINGRNGAASNVTFSGQAAVFNGTSSYIDIYSASLAAAFSGAEGTMLGRFKVAGSGVWTDGVVRYCWNLRADDNNYSAAYKRAANNGLAGDYRANTTQEFITSNAISTVDWFTIAVTWSKSNERVRLFVDGAQNGVDSTTLGVFAGSLSNLTTLIGASNKVPTTVWSGSASRCLLLNREATPTEVSQIDTILNP